MAFPIFLRLLAVQSEIWKYVLSWPVRQTEFHIKIKNATRHFKGVNTRVYSVDKVSSFH